MTAFVSRAGEKLAFALYEFKIDVKGKTCADFGSSTGGFVDCLIQQGAEKVYAVETGYGTLDWKLRNDERVVVMERTNAMHVELPETVDFITIDTSWTKLEKIIPNARKNLKPGGEIVALLKPHYEAESRMLKKGKLEDEYVPKILDEVKAQIESLGTNVVETVESPIVGKKGGNIEFLLHIKPNKKKSDTDS